MPLASAAAQGGSIHDCESLIEIGADINWRGPQGDSPLLAACRRGHTETVAYLLAHGADANVQGEDSLTAAHIIAKRGDAATLSVLLQASVDVSMRANNGQTCSDIAKAKGFQEIYARLHHATQAQKQWTALPVGRQQSSNRPIAGVSAAAGTGTGAGVGGIFRGRTNLPSLAVQSQVSLSSVVSSMVTAEDASAQAGVVEREREHRDSSAVSTAAALASHPFSSLSAREPGAALPSDAVGRTFRPAPLPSHTDPGVSISAPHAVSEPGMEAFNDAEGAYLLGTSGSTTSTVPSSSSRAAPSSSVLSIRHASSTSHVAHPDPPHSRAARAQAKIVSSPDANSAGMDLARVARSARVSVASPQLGIQQQAQRRQSQQTTQPEDGAALPITHTPATQTQGINLTLASAPEPSVGSDEKGSGVKNGAAHFATLLDYDAKFQTLRVRLEQELKERRVLDSKLALLKDQNAYLATELSSLRHELSVVAMERNECKDKIQLYTGDSVAVSRSLGSVEECDELEKELKAALDVVEAHKAVLVRDRLDKEKEQRLCVVCQEAEKSVVLLPCRHLCLCDACSLHEQLAHCPLCRRTIAHKISVYA